jgi:hypothetical protein
MIQPTKTNRLAVLQSIGIILLLLLLVLLLYTFAHEGGHALVGLLFGGKITSFSVNFFDMSAHVGIDGDFPSFQHSLISVAGVSLPLALCLLFILATPKRGDAILEWFKLIAILSTVNTLLAWIVIPVLVLTGQTVGDDSANFLGYSHVHPLVVTGTALLVYLGFGALALRQMGGWRGLKDRFQNQSLELGSPTARKTMVSLAALGLVVASATLALSLAFPDRMLQAPDGYQLAAKLDLSQQSYVNADVYPFVLNQPSAVSFFIALQEIQGAPVKIELSGPNGYSNVLVLLEDPAANIGRATVHPQDIALQSGAYHLQVTLPGSKGTVRVYTR